MVYIIWIILCFILANAGGKRKIGAVPAFFISLLLSPLIGLIVVVLSEKREPGSLSKPDSELRYNELRDKGSKFETEGLWTEALETYKEARKVLFDCYDSVREKKMPGIQNDVTRVTNKLEETKSI
jgi:hypothetical protein